MKIVFAGGGTAGHIEPALAVAREWASRYSKDELLFLGTASGLETELVPKAGFTLFLIPRVRIPRRISPRLLLAPISLIQAVTKSMQALQGAGVLIGFGGYVSAPAYIAAKIKRVPIVIHEANAKPGIANRLGALFTQYLAVATPVEKGKFAKALITGLPLREDVALALQGAAGGWESARKEAKTSLGFKDTSPLVLIVGGSQGAQAINHCIAESKDSLLEQQIQILHALGKRNILPEPSTGYLPTAYIDEMATAYLAADLIIARSGAVTCSEINALGRYALFIPLAIGNGEQRFNAQNLVDQGRAEVLDQREFTSTWLRLNIDRLLQESSRKSMEGSTSDVDAALKIANLMELAQRGGSL